MRQRYRVNIIDIGQQYILSEYAMNAKLDNARTQVLIPDEPGSAVDELLSTRVLVEGKAQARTLRDDPSVGRAVVDDEPEAPVSRQASIFASLSLATVLQLAFMALCSVGLALLLIRFAPLLESLGNWGYVGVAAVEFGNSAMLAIPTPSYAYTFTMGSMLNPFAVGVIGGTFAMLGELIGYYLGRRGSAILPESPRIERFKSWTNRWGAVTLFWFAILPVPFDIAGIWAGAARYPLVRFIPLVTLGKTIKVTLIALAGYFGMDALAGFGAGFGI